ncbi:MAG: heat shock protein transcriptional repressor HspR [Thermoleophilia bacterium]|jgi:MerR family transcriptional regulator/heat shock protein HspR|nr:MerR family transcriptional regulator [Actinomycetota bacterium]MCL6092397.1 MerR family transcriptional regulator [Actinomycetota bacterium]
MISVAAELAGMHPQTLRIYEQKGLITPARTPRNTRLYSEEDIERLKKIQEFTTRLGMNLAGVEKVLELECRINDLEGSIAALRAEVAEAAGRLQREVEAVHRSYRRELVPVSRGEIILRRRRR